jgi:hypothetical protein
MSVGLGVGVLLGVLVGVCVFVGAGVGVGGVQMSANWSAGSDAPLPNSPSPHAQPSTSPGLTTRLLVPIPEYSHAPLFS